MPADTFLKNLKPVGEPLGKPGTYRLSDSLEKFLEDVAAVRKTRKSNVLREIVLAAKMQWDQMTPTQRKGASYE